MSGLSQQAFSEKYSIPKRSIENWETGSSNLSTPFTGTCCKKEFSDSRNVAKSRKPKMAAGQIIYPAAYQLRSLPFS